jgi:acetylglutamate kinase
VLDDGGRTIARLDRPAAERLIASGVASAGMVVKLRACLDALARGAREVVLMDGRDPAALRAALAAGPDDTAGLPVTRMVD